jgi:hypothetical protein
VQARQECARAKRPRRIAGDFQRPQAGLLQILVERGNGRIADHIAGPCTGKAATGTPQASASSITSPKVSVRLGNTNTSLAA